MKKGNRPYLLFIQDILLSMQRILDYTEAMNLNAFEADQFTIDATLMNFIILGEATANIPENLKKKYPNVPWREMKDLRNKVSHEYFGVDLSIVWHIITNFIPENKKQIENILQIERKS